MGPLIPSFPQVLKVLDKLIRNFLWHGKKERKGYNLVKWNTKQNSKEHGG